MKINNIRIPEWHDLKTDNIIVREISEPLIKLPEDSARIIYEPKYALQNIPGATTICRMRREVFIMLNRAIDLLPEGFGFKIFDAWRPVAVQKFLFDRYANKLIAEKGISREKADLLARQFVSYPEKNPLRPFVHSTGGAVDLTVMDSNGQELDMGTDFDDFTSNAYTDAFENKEDCEAFKNRRLLFEAMTSAGFTNYPSEWWHYDYGDLFWAAETGTDCAMYGGVFEGGSK